MRLPANVKRGSLMLDERLPGWREYIDLDKLDMGNGCNCVLGEVFGDYERGLDLLGMDHDASQWYGFFTLPRQGFVTLTEAWRKVVTR